MRMGAVKKEITILQGFQGSEIATLAFNWDTKVADIKNEIHARIGVNRSRLILIWNCGPLDDTQTLDEAGVPSGACLQVIIEQPSLALSGCQDGQMILWELNDAKCLRDFDGGGVTVKAISADWSGMLAIAGYANGCLKMWELQTGACLLEFAGHEDSVRSIVANWEVSQALSCSQDASVKLWDMSTGSCLRSFQGHRGHVLTVTIDWSLRRMMSGGQDCKVLIWELDTGHCIGQLQGHTRHVSAVECDWHGLQALSGSYDHFLKLWNLSTHTLVRSFDVHGQVRGFVANSDRVCSMTVDWVQRRAMSCTSKKGVKVWDLDTAACLFSFDWKGAPVCSVASLTWSKQRVLSGHSDRRMRLWDSETGAQFLCFNGHLSPLTAVCVDW